MSKSVTVELPEALVQEIERVGAGEPLADFVANAARERAESLASNSFFARRAQPFDREALRALLRRDGGEPPPHREQ